MQEMWVRSLDWEDPLEKIMATHSSILAWEIPWTEELGGLQTIGQQKVGHKLVNQQLYIYIYICTCGKLLQACLKELDTLHNWTTNIHMCVCVCVCVYKILIICRFSICELTYLLKFTWNIKINTQSVFIVIGNCAQISKIFELSNAHVPISTRWCSAFLFQILYPKYIPFLVVFL